MDAAKRKILEDAGFTVGTVAEFLELSPAENDFVEIKVALSTAFKCRRREQSVTRQRLAEMMHSSQSRLAKMEAGEASVSLDLLIRALLALDMPRAELSSVMAARAEAVHSIQRPWKHFIIFIRTNNHCANFLVRASSLRDAMATYSLGERPGGELLEDGSIRKDDSWGGQIVYSHPLECIESEEKSRDGLYGQSWEISELQDQHWSAEFAEAFSSADPSDIEGYISLCRPVFHAAFPRLRSRAFVWYLKDGPLVTFHRRVNPRRKWPVEIIARYLLPWKEWGQVRQWHGTHDDILEQMNVEYPLPRP